MRDYVQCEADCPPDYSGTYQDGITLYQVTDRLTKIGPLQRNTQLSDVDAGRLLLSRGTTLEVVTPNQGAQALYITAPQPVNSAFLSGNTVLAVTGTTLTSYDATTGTQTATRSLPPGTTVYDFSQGLVLYITNHQIHLLRLADGRDRRVATVMRLLTARLDSKGLFYAANSCLLGLGTCRKPNARAAAQVSFVSFAALNRLLGSGG